MASAARCVRSLLRNSSNINLSSKAVMRCLNGSTSGTAKTKLSTSLRSSLKEAGLLNSSKNYSLTSKVNFSKNFRPASMLCNLSTMSLLITEVTVGSSDAVDGSDDDGETWNGKESYISDDT